MDYGMPSYRKTKRDKKAKGKYKPYRRGGKYRSTDIVEGKENRSERR